MPPDVLLLAAGRGRRLRPLTDATPKALLPVGGRALIERHLQRLAALGFTGAVVNLAHLGDKIRAHLTDERRHGLDVRFSPEPDGALDTGGGVARALDKLRGDPFLVVNADIVCDFNFAALALPDGLDLRLVLAPTPAHRRRGDFKLDGDGKLRLLGDDGDGDRAGDDGGDGDDGDGNDAADWTFTGIGIYRRRVFAGRTGKFPLLPVIEKTINDGRAGGVVHRGLWLDAGTPARLTTARRLLQD